METLDLFPREVKTIFSFLIEDFGFTLEVETLKLYAAIEFHTADRVVDINYDFRDCFFYFNIMRKINSDIPDYGDKENVMTFLELFEAKNPNDDYSDIQPPELYQWRNALNRNAELLRMHGDDVLLGKEWISLKNRKQ